MTARLMPIEGERTEVREPRIKLVPFEKIRLGRARRYLVGDFIPRVGLTVVWGPPKSGKSFWTFDLAMHVALGWEYRGRRVSQGSVVYCCFEGQSGIEARVEAFRQHHLAEEADTAIPFFLEPVTLDLVGDVEELIGAVRASLDGDPALVVLDTLNRSFRGSESSDADMTAYVKAADALRDAFTCAVVVVHHCGFEGTRPRGHSSLIGALDAQLGVSRDAAGNIVVTAEEMKDGETGSSIASRLEVIDLGPDEDGAPITSCVITPTEALASPSKKGSRLTKGARIALNALREAVGDAGEVAPTSNHIPSAAKVVPFSLWRKYAYERGISGSEEARARQLAFQRGAEALYAAGIANTWEDVCWLTG